MSTILDEIKTLAASVLCFDRDEISEKSRLVDDLGADSLDEVELVIAAEDFFGISIDDEKAKQFKTVGDVEAYVKMAVADREMQGAGG